MKLRIQMLPITLLVLLAGMPALAQVEKVAARTKGLSCGACGAIVEVYLRHLPGVQDLSMSMSKELVLLTYKPGTSFDPFGIRDALDKSEVAVLQFQISARGHVHDEGGKRFFVAGKDKFLLVETAATPKVPSDTDVSIEGVVNDHPNPMELRILNSKPLK